MAATVNQIRFEALKEHDHIKVTQRIKVGLKIWYTSVSGKVVRTERRRNGLHVDRSKDDKAFQDVIVLFRDGSHPELTTVTMDEFTVLETLPE